MVWKAGVIGDAIHYHGNVRALAERLESTVTEFGDPKVKLRSMKQSKRARDFDRRLREIASKPAFEGEAANLRVIMGDGHVVDEEELGNKTSTMSKKVLDNELWHIHRYNDSSGEFHLVRGMLASSTTLEISKVAADQHELQQPPSRKQSTSFVYCRSPRVRREVLDRSKGRCELCGEHGILMDDGRYYLETNHIIPLSEGGVDTVDNVVALCPNDHMRAHYSKDKFTIRNQLQSCLKALDV